MATGSYFSRRSARDPDWRDAQIADALERDRRRRERDPERFRAERRRASRRCRERQRQAGLTFQELLLRVGGDRHSLALVLRDEIARGRVAYHSTSRRYVPNGGLPADVKRALLDL